MSKRKEPEKNSSSSEIPVTKRTSEKKAMEKLYPGAKWYYAVHNSHDVNLGGVFNTWDECKSKSCGISGTTFKKFMSQKAAIEFFNFGPKCVYLTHPQFVDAPDKDGVKQTNISSYFSKLPPPKSLAGVAAAAVKKQPLSLKSLEQIASEKRDKLKLEKKRQFEIALSKKDDGPSLPTVTKEKRMTVKEMVKENNNNNNSSSSYDYSEEHPSPDIMLPDIDPIEDQDEESTQEMKDDDDDNTPPTPIAALFTEDESKKIVKEFWDEVKKERADKMKKSNKKALV